ncbi:MAG TPA: four helix bundle protein [Gemmatimonadaceae bacterium]|nr:four helix bundle protein [Gemmatimonadaceae bacterium]
MQEFQHIKAWQRAHALAVALHKRARNFSRLGYSRLRAQLTGAADSIGDTIAEGAGAATAKEFARYLDMSIKSANETEGHLLKARDLDLFSPEEWQAYSAEVIEIRKMTYSCRRTMLANDKKTSDKKPNDRKAGDKSLKWLASKEPDA